jgi:uncharacterized protein (TIGR01777 family)
MKIFFTGGTGFVGAYLTRRLAQQGHEITILTRSSGAQGRSSGEISFVTGDPLKPGNWQQMLFDHDAIINLAGGSIFRRWTKKARKTIRDSRILVTRHVVDALTDDSLEAKTRVLISASAVGYYGSSHKDDEIDESSPSGNDFLAELARDWESEACKGESAGLRVVTTRFGVVLGRNGGALKQMLPAFRKGLGSPLGSGKQWFPWIHEEDLFNIMTFLLNKDTLSGPVNCTAPNPVTNREMSKSLAKTLHRPLLPSVPGFVIKTALGEFGNVLLKGQRVIPKRLLENGFSFSFPTLPEALDDLLAKSRK